MVLTDGEDDSLAGLPLYIAAGKYHSHSKAKIGLDWILLREGVKNASHSLKSESKTMDGEDQGEINFAIFFLYL